MYIKGNLWVWIWGVILRKRGTGRNCNVRSNRDRISDEASLLQFHKTWPFPKSHRNGFLHKFLRLARLHYAKGPKLDGFLRSKLPPKPTRKWIQLFHHGMETHGVRAVALCLPLETYKKLVAQVGYSPTTCPL